MLALFYITFFMILSHKSSVMFVSMHKLFGVAVLYCIKNDLNKPLDGSSLIQ